jgi:hypothetical protein
VCAVALLVAAAAAHEEDGGGGCPHHHEQGEHHHHGHHDHDHGHEHEHDGGADDDDGRPADWVAQYTDASGKVHRTATSFVASRVHLLTPFNLQTTVLAALRRRAAEAFVVLLYSPRSALCDEVHPRFVALANATGHSAKPAANATAGNVADGSASNSAVYFGQYNVDAVSEVEGADGDHDAVAFLRGLAAARELMADVPSVAVFTSAGEESAVSVAGWDGELSRPAVARRYGGPDAAGGGPDDLAVGTFAAGLLEV